ncbi:hypothetical protein GJV44_00879 [Candidatus Vallotia cooleyia]|nr:hypothetical protein GJV44_00879 [Candidatus Vallotia cooleyia]
MKRKLNHSTSYVHWESIDDSIQQVYYGSILGQWYCPSLAKILQEKFAISSRKRRECSKSSIIKS